MVDDREESDNRPEITESMAVHMMLAIVPVPRRSRHQVTPCSADELDRYHRLFGAGEMSSPSSCRCG
jgi:hypothetical protein